MFLYGFTININDFDLALFGRHARSDKRLNDYSESIASETLSLLFGAQQGVNRSLSPRCRRLIDSKFGRYAMMAAIIAAKFLNAPNGNA